MKRKLLSVLLTLCLAFSLLPTAALADGEGTQTNDVAQIGETKYATLADAIAAAKRNNTVTLLADTRENVTISTPYVTLDLNGHTLNGGTEKAKPALTITARVTVKDSSTAQTGTIMREDTAENSGVSSHYVIDVQGDGWLTFESGKVTNNSGNAAGKGASLVRVGDDSVAKYPGLNIKGGTFTQDNFIVIKVDRGDLFLNGGTLNSTSSYAVENWHRATIKGGTVNGAVSSWTYSSGSNSDLTIEGGTVNGNVESVSYDGAEGKLAKVTINGGTVNGEMYTIAYDENTNTLKQTDDASKATIKVTGGTFSKDPSKYLVEGSAVTQNGDGTFGVAKAYLAQVGETSYYTMDEAFKAQTARGAEIVLLRDYTTGSTFNSGTVARVVNLNGHTWTCTGTDANSAAFEINYADASLTVKNGKIVSSQLVGLIPSAMGGTIMYDNSSITFENVEMSTTATSGIETNGNNTNDSVTLKNSTLNVPNGFGIYFPSSGTLTIDNSTINAKTMGVQVCAGSLSINDGSKIIVNGDAVPKTENDGAIQDGAAISIVNRTGYKGLGEIAVTGGTFTAKSGNDAIKAYDYVNKSESEFTVPETVSVSGGTFSSAVPENCCAPGFVPTQNGNTYGVKINEKMAAEVLDAQGNTVGAYGTLAAAITEAKNGETVKLLSDVTANVTIPEDKTITLDLNGKVLSGGTVASTPALLNNGTVTIKDSSAEGTGMICREDNNAAGYYVIDNQGTMTIENGSVYNATGTMPNGSSLIRNAGKSNEATLTINGGHIKQDGFIAIKNDDHGVLEINGGLIETSGDTATNTASAVQNWAKATINNGTINGTIWVGVWSNGLPDSVTTIKNAEVNGKIVVKPDSSGLTVAPKLNIEGGNFDVTGWDVSNSDNIDISGGSFSTDLKNTGYLADSVGAEVKSADGSTYSYYTSMDDALAAAKPGDTVTDLKAAEQKVTLTLKYNDGATADTTYNVASGTTITLPTPAHRSGYTFNGWYDGSTKVSSSYKVTKNVTLTASWSYNYSSGSSSYDPTYSVSTPSKTKNGSVTVSPKSASKGDTVTVTVKPDSGYVLETLTVTDKNGNELTLKDKGNGKYTFTMPAGKVEVKATFMEDNSMLNFFYDVPNNAYFYEAVKWAVENGITTGVGNDLFAPEQPCTRAQIVTFLWRAAGSPEPKGAASGMTDVVSGSYYEKAVAWAIENGITTGTTTSTFSPDATCTRAQAVTFLARALKAKAASAAEFSDVPNDSYFADAVAWAAANGVTEGIGGGLFGSDNDCTRGQIVTFLYRAYNK